MPGCPGSPIADRQYKYEPLEHDEIRLLELLPGERWSTPSMTLTKRKFRETESEPQYEALSYAWGNPQELKTVHIVSGRRLWNLSVTKNCDNALRRLRSVKGKRRTLWIDAICINQADPAERSSQVANMGRVYSASSKVNAWIGEKCCTSSVAIEWIRAVSSVFNLNTTSGVLTPLTDDPVWKGTWSTLSRQQMQALADLISRQWFERLWIWQEIRLGKERSFLLCGDEELPWSSFCKAIQYLTGKFLPDLPGFTRIRQRLPLLTRLTSNPRSPQMRFLNAMRECKCHDPRDRVYTAQSLANVKYKFRVPPNYSECVQDVFTKWALSFLAVNNTVDFLQYTSSTQALSDLPSWVPDWSVCATTRRFVYAYAGALSKAVTSLLDGNVLRVKGVQVGVITHTLPFTQQKRDAESQDKMHTLRQYGARLSAFLSSTPSPKVHSTRTRELCDLLRIGDWQEAYVPPRTDRPRREDCENLLDDLLAGGHNADKYDQQLLESIMHPSSGQTLVQSSTNNLGLAPLGTETGDVLSAVLGCDAIMVLRPISSEQFCVIGPAYYAGYMNGEGILGQLPEFCERVHVLPRSKGKYINRFRCGESGGIQFKDPRLPALPAQWIATSPKGMLPKYLNTETGERRGFKADPRCDPQELASRGVKIKDFDLI